MYNHLTKRHVDMVNHGVKSMDIRRGISGDIEKSAKRSAAAPALAAIRAACVWQRWRLLAPSPTRAAASTRRARYGEQRICFRALCAFAAAAGRWRAGCSIAIAVPRHARTVALLPAGARITLLPAHRRAICHGCLASVAYRGWRRRKNSGVKKTAHWRGFITAARACCCTLCRALRYHTRQRWHQHNARYQHSISAWRGCGLVAYQWQRACRRVSYRVTP